MVQYIWEIIDGPVNPLLLSILNDRVTTSICLGLPLLNNAVIKHVTDHLAWFGGNPGEGWWRLQVD